MPEPVTVYAVVSEATGDVLTVNKYRDQAEAMREFYAHKSVQCFRVVKLQEVPE